MVDPTAFARLIPQHRGGGLAAISAMRQGTEIGMAEQAYRQAQTEKADIKNLGRQVLDAWKAGDQSTVRQLIGQMHSIDPTAAKETYAMFGDLDKTRAVESGTNFYAASALPPTDVDRQNAILQKAKEPLPQGHPFVAEIDNIMRMTDPDERQESILTGLNVAANLGMIPGAEPGEASEKQKTGTYLVRDKKTNQLKLITGVFDKKTASFTTADAPIPSSYEILSREGETPQEASDRKALESKIKKQTDIALEKGAGYSEKAEGLNSNIIALDEGIVLAERAIKEGKSLGRGWLENKLPKLSETAASFQQIADQLGLSVVSAVSFGALSEKELRVAQETALPNYAKDEDTLAWMRRRRDALNKLRNYYREAAAFLSAGNTIEDFEKMMLEKAKQNDAQFKGQAKQDYTQMSSIDIMQNLVKSMGQ